MHHQEPVLLLTLAQEDNMIENAMITLALIWLASWIFGIWEDWSTAGPPDRPRDQPHQQGEDQSSPGWLPADRD